MYPELKTTIAQILTKPVSETRKQILEDAAAFIQQKSNLNQRININCICTHNSRRSHLCQVWSKVAGMYYRIRKTNTYSGGTEATAVYSQVIETLKDQGFNIMILSEGSNPVYALKFAPDAPPLHLFSKKYDSAYNPEENQIAFINCSDADRKCPIILGAEKRYSIGYVDPKRSDNTEDQAKVYLETSELIASEMFYLFSKINK